MSGSLCTQNPTDGIAALCRPSSGTWSPTLLAGTELANGDTPIGPSKLNGTAIIPARTSAGPSSNIPRLNNCNN